jgi:hypothetical protein
MIGGTRTSNGKHQCYGAKLRYCRISIKQASFCFCFYPSKRKIHMLQPDTSTEIANSQAAPHNSISQGRSRLRHQRTLITIAFCALINVVAIPIACAHGFAGKRFFPATLSTDDPFVSDELSLPTISSRKTAADGDDPATRETITSVDFTKRITPNFGLGLGADYLHLQPNGAPSQNGFDNLSANVKYQFYENDAHEAIFSIGADWDIGGTGSKHVGADSFSTITPTLFFGKGFGDLPDQVAYLKPLAITGTVGIAMPTRASTTTVDDNGNFTTEQHPNVLQTGFAVEYSLPYLQSFVKDVGLRGPFSRMIPLVEFSLQTPLDRGGGPTTGTVNPGVVWAGRYMQSGIEAVIPINSNTGGKTGVMAQLHFFLDDIFPKSIGKPLFQSQP